jgi:hypothetical protein
MQIIGIAMWIIIDFPLKQTTTVTRPKSITHRN